MTTLLNAFVDYVNEWQRLADEYNRIPSWRTFKQLGNIRKREKLTKAYTKQMQEMGII